MAENKIDKKISRKEIIDRCEKGNHMWRWLSKNLKKSKTNYFLTFDIDINFAFPKQSENLCHFCEMASVPPLRNYIAIDCGLCLGRSILFCDRQTRLIKKLKTKRDAWYYYSRSNGHYVRKTRRDFLLKDKKANRNERIYAAAQIAQLFLDVARTERMEGSAEQALTGEYCETCGKFVKGFKYIFCCSGSECACMGLPIEHCFCSRKCNEKFIKKFLTL